MASLGDALAGGSSSSVNIVGYNREASKTSSGLIALNDDIAVKRISSDDRNNSLN
jgi:hypothetical protein